MLVGIKPAAPSKLEFNELINSVCMRPLISSRPSKGASEYRGPCDDLNAALFSVFICMGRVGGGGNLKFVGCN